jgi:hypothetical protein
MSEKPTALQRIDAAVQSGALIYFDKSNAIPTIDLYKPDITIMKIKIEDCHKIKSGKDTVFMPKKEITDRIAEANGIVFVTGDTRRESLEDAACGKRTIFIGYAQGKKRLPDGSWRTSNIANYEFDPTLRTMLDFDVTELTAETKQKRKSYDGKAYGPTLARAVMECEKFATQRASTGARLMVIRELAGIPIAFSEKEILKEILFMRIIQNTEYILQTPEGRAMATAQALGWNSASIFGAKKPAIASNAATDVPDSGTEPSYELVPNSDKNDTPEPENKNGAEGLAAEAAAENSGEEMPFGEEDDGGEFEKLTTALEEYITGYKEHLTLNAKGGINPYQKAMAELENKNATVESRRSMIEKVRNWLVAHNVQGVA